MTDPVQNPTVLRERAGRLRREADAAAEAYRTATMNIFAHWTAWDRAEAVARAAAMEARDAR